MTYLTFFNGNYLIPQQQKNNSIDVMKEHIEHLILIFEVLKWIILIIQVCIIEKWWFSIHQQNYQNSKLDNSFIIQCLYSIYVTKLVLWILSSSVIFLFPIYQKSSCASVGVLYAHFQYIVCLSECLKASCLNHNIMHFLSFLLTCFILKKSSFT